MASADESATEKLEHSETIANEPLLEARATRFDPVVRNIEGWTVHVDPALFSGANGDDGSRALGMLANHFQRICVLIPTEPLEKLKTVEIWIEQDHPRLHSMQYHPSRGWLIANGHDERLAKKVHITQADQLLSKAQMLKHPAVILHELAHAYHDQFLSFDNPEIIAAFEQAKQSHSYEKRTLYQLSCQRRRTQKDSLSFLDKRQIRSGASVWSVIKEV